MKFLIFATFVTAQPGSMTSLLHFGDIIEKNILTIINNPNRKLEFLINHENLYRFGFNYCDAGKTKNVLKGQIIKGIFTPEIAYNLMTSG